MIEGRGRNVTYPENSYSCLWGNFFRNKTLSGIVVLGMGLFLIFAFFYIILSHYCESI